MKSKSRNQDLMGSCDFFVCVFSMAAELPLPETNKSHLKMDAWKTMNFPFGMDTFLAGVFAVSFREAMFFKEFSTDFSGSCKRW